MELFNTAGHLTDTALQAALLETLDEMARLEVAEHLSYCDGCLARYTALLTDDTLRTPVQPLRAPVLSRIRQKALHLVFNRCTTYAAAAVFALVLWGTGAFNLLGVPQKPVPATEPPRQSITQQTNAALRQLGEALSQGVAHIRLPQADLNIERES